MRKMDQSGFAVRFVAALFAFILAISPVSAFAVSVDDVESGECAEVIVEGAPEYGRLDTWGSESEGISPYDARSFTDAQREGLQTALRQGYDSVATKIDIQGFDVLIGEQDLLSEVIYGVLDDPRYWYVKKGFSIGYLPSTGQVFYVTPLYIAEDPDELPAYVAKMNAAVTEALGWVSPSMTDLQKAQVIHDYLVRTCAYVHDDSYTQYSAYGPLVLRQGVCEGYAMAYKLLMAKLGIDCIYVSSDEMNHGWNMVKLDGRWYHVDVTWDDPLYHGVGDLGFDVEGHVGALSHENFLRSDASMEATGHHGWVSSVAAPDDYFADHDSVTWPIYRAPAEGIPDPDPTVLPGFDVKPSQPDPKPSAPVTPKPSAPPAVQKAQTMHRLYNPNSGEHFYTAHVAERDSLVAVGWQYEGTAWNAPQSGQPVYRMYNANAGDHHYTPSEVERDSLVESGWSFEGIGWYSDAAQKTPLYRLYNPNAVAGAHHYTTDAAERDSLVSIGWRDEGVGWYGM